MLVVVPNCSEHNEPGGHTQYEPKDCKQDDLWTQVDDLLSKKVVVGIKGAVVVGALKVVVGINGEVVVVI